MYIGIVTVDGECQPNNGHIENCCCLGYNNNNYNVKSSGDYTIKGSGIGGAGRL